MIFTFLFWFPSFRMTERTRDRYSPLAQYSLMLLIIFPFAGGWQQGSFRNIYFNSCHQWKWLFIGAQFLWLSFLDNSPRIPGAVVFSTKMRRLITLADRNQIHLEYLVTLNSNWSFHLASLETLSPFLKIYLKYV